MPSGVHRICRRRLLEPRAAQLVAGADVAALAGPRLPPLVFARPFGSRGWRWSRYAAQHQSRWAVRTASLPEAKAKGRACRRTESIGMSGVTLLTLQTRATRGGVDGS